MKKIVCIGLFAVVFLFAHTMVNAQIKFGVRAGLSNSTLKMKDITAYTDDGLTQEAGDSILMKAGDAKVGVHVGVIGQVEIGSLFLQPELLFSSVGGEVIVKDLFDENAKEEVKSQRFSRIDVPILIGKKFGPLKVEAGPVASFFLSQKSGLKDAVKEVVNESQEQGVKENFKKALWGGQVGVGLDIWKLGIDLKYEFSLSKFGDNISLFDEDWKTDTRTNQILLSVAYFF